MAKPNEQINDTDRIDKVRLELDGKIEKRVPYWVLWPLVAVIVAVLGGIFVQISVTNNNLDDIKNRVTIIETKSEATKK